MKWYFASRTRHQARLLEIKKQLEAVGETVVSDWVHVEKFDSYEKELERTQALSKDIVKALLETNIFVLISDPKGTDMFVELGICLAVHELQNNNRVYIVGEHSKRSLMQLHPSIVHVQTLKELFDKENISLSEAIPEVEQWDVE